MVLPPCVVWFPHSHLALFYPCYQDIILPHWQDDGFRVTFTIKICYSPNRPSHCLLYENQWESWAGKGGRGGGGGWETGRE